MIGFFLFVIHEKCLIIQPTVIHFTEIIISKEICFHFLHMFRIFPISINRVFTERTHDDATTVKIG